MSGVSDAPDPSSSRLMAATQPAFARLRTTFIDRRHPPGSPSISSDASSTSSNSVDQEWDENIRQLHLLIDIILLPFVGKWLGRKAAYWLYARYAQRGINALGVAKQVTRRWI